VVLHLRLFGSFGITLIIQRRHRERPFIKNRNNALLRQQQLNHAFPLMQIQLDVLFLRSIRGLSGHGHAEAVVPRVVLFAFGVAGLHLAFAFHFFNGVSEEDFQLGLLTQLLIVLHSSCLELPPFMFHHLAQLLDDSFISTDLVFLVLLLGLRLVDNGA